MTWYYNDGRTQVGPIGESEIFGLAQSGKIKRDTLVWKEGTPAWREAGSTELASHLALEPPPLYPSAQYDASRTKQLGFFEDAWNIFLGVLNKYAVFTGRARRREYWMFFLCSFVVALVLAVMDAICFGGNEILGTIYRLGLLVPSLAVAIRRMHDGDHSGWWILCPIVNLVYLIAEGTRGGNRFGPDPKSNLMG